MESNDLWSSGFVAEPTFWINHASRLIMREFEQLLRPLGFGTAYLPVVMLLEQHRELQQRQLADFVRVEQPTMAALLTRMQRDGLIVRTPHPTDARSSLISLSPKALERLPEVMAVLGDGVGRALDGVPEEDRAALQRILRIVVTNLGGIP
ncbi:MarR family winged helix-turn-helix transcriptional regulator [Catenuloplanes japonicus]|uniref:MarR family winged helix-turn-helix transcriptional regulator n=1 Tax=Catenuloplanes japonicus TaxID=33876 RepID=UPI00068CC9A0|nr:MarR family transcriptional regulator [Catenuloplanes japonicus]